MEFDGIMKKMIQVAKEDVKVIALTELNDVRVLKAASIVASEKIAKIVLIGDPKEVEEICLKEKIDLSSPYISFRNPLTDKDREKCILEFYELRKEKGMTLEEAKEKMKDPMYFATMLAQIDEIDGVVSGAVHSTANTLRPALQIIKGAKGVTTISSFFLIETHKKELGNSGVLLFSDCGLIEFPTEEQLVDIAIASAQSFRLLTKQEPKVAFLSYSTKGSAKNPSIDKLVHVVEELKQRKVDFEVDGELQLDAAIIPEVAKIKAPDSPVAGKANVLIFPNLEAGNIGYKMAQRFGDTLALGPVMQGLRKPINDLSRGCNVADIIGTIAVTCVQTGK